MRVTKAVAVALAMTALLSSPLQLGAQEEKKAAGTKPHVKRVALFKNGLAFFVSESMLPQGMEGPIAVGPFLAPAHGTFWVSHPAAVKLRDIVARETDAWELTDAITVAELIKANVGRRARLYVGGGADPLEGVIKRASADRELDRPDPYMAGSAAAVRRGYVQGQLIVVEAGERLVALDPRSVQRVVFLDGEVSYSIRRKTKAVELVARLEEPAPGEVITATYLAKGITWAPSYVVDISDPEKATLSAKAVVINEAVDLEDVEVALVTGFPHLRFADVVSPLAFKEDLAAFLQSLDREESPARRRRSVVTQQRADYYRPPERRSAMPQYGSARAGAVAEDLFLYPVGSVRLRKGETGYFPLFSETVPYKHIYQWTIPDYVNEEDRYGRRRGEEPEKREVVWHSLRLENTTKVPWTTAPAETVQGSQILGQDAMHYTPPAAETTLRITQALGVKAEEMEFEKDRQRDAARYYGHHYDRVTVEGKLTVRNFQGKAITLEISKALSGEVKSSAPEAKIKKLARGLRRMNPANELTWTLELGPDEGKDIEYEYDVLIRR